MGSVDIQNLNVDQSKVNLHGKILFGKIIRHLNPEIGKMLVKSMFANQDSTFHSGP